MNALIQTTRSVRAAERGVLAVTLANIIEIRQDEAPGVLSVFCLADVREWFPSFSARRVFELLQSIVTIEWFADTDALRQPMPIFWQVRESGQTFVVEVDRRYLLRREQAKIDPAIQLPELVGKSEADAAAVLKARGLAVRIAAIDDRPTSGLSSADIRRDRANLRIVGGVVASAYLG